MRDWIAAIAGIVFITFMIGLAIWWQVYRFHDCRRVGHTRTYCIFTIGK